MDIVNAAVECIDRAPPDRCALVWMGPEGERRFTFADLAAATNRFANAARNLGAQRRDVIVTMLPRCPEWIFAAFGAMKLGGTFAALDPAWSDDRIFTFLARTEAKQAYVDARWKARLDPMRADLLMLWHVVSVERFAKTPRMGAGDFLFHDYFDPAAAAFDPARTRSVDRALAVAAGDRIALHGHAFLAGAEAFARESLGARLAMDMPTHDPVGVAAIAGAWRCGAEVTLAADGLPAPEGSVALSRALADAWVPPGFLLPLAVAGRARVPLGESGGRLILPWAPEMGPLEFWGESKVPPVWDLGFGRLGPNSTVIVDSPHGES